MFQSRYPAIRRTDKYPTITTPPSNLQIYPKIISYHVFHSHKLFINFVKSSLPSKLAMTDVTFGPPGQEWHYSRTNRTYDISGASTRKVTIATTKGPEDTSFTIAPEKSALVIVDMQNFFLDPKCMNHPNGLAAVEPTIASISKCRALGIQVYLQSLTPLVMDLTHT